MKTIYTGKNEKIRAAVAYINNDLAHNQEFWNDIRAHEGFDHAERTPAEIVQSMQEKEKPSEVKVYTPSRFSRVVNRSTIAYVSPSRPHTLYYNSYKLFRNIEKIVNTIVHEYVHSVDWSEEHSRSIDYGHAGNSSAGKQNTAPYWIGKLAETYFLKSAAEETVIDEVLEEELLTHTESERAVFSGEPLTRWNGNRNMTLEEEFFYVDPFGKKWVAPKDSCLNGATIPKSLWSIVGSPYSGPYRKASVVHDVAVGELCNPEVSYAERKLADKMFYHACRSGGCSVTHAGLLYIGVRFGTWRSKYLSFLKSSEFKDRGFKRHNPNEEYERAEFWNLVEAAETAIELEDLDTIDVIIEQQLGETGSEF